MRRGEVRAARLGEARAGAVRERVADALRQAVPGAAVSVEGEAVVIAERGLHWRAATDPALRSVAEMLR
jgi:hypothetical protein